MARMTPKQRLEFYAQHNYDWRRASLEEHVQAVAALYIGDGLREIAQAIANGANPTTSATGTFSPIPSTPKQRIEELLGEIEFWMGEWESQQEV